MAHRPVRQVIFPVAGFGTRTLPASKSIPKEMLPILDRPLIDYAIDEAWQAGIERIILVTGRGKQALEDYFDHHPELEAKLAQTNKLDRLNRLYPAGSLAFVRQPKALGLGHAVWCARQFLIPGEAFAVILPDDLIIPPSDDNNQRGKGCIAQLIDNYQAMDGGNHLAVMEIEKERVPQFGIIDAENISDGHQSVKIKAMIEKPSLAEAPSQLAIIGRYVLEPDVMDVLAKQQSGAIGEIQLTDAMAARLALGDAYYGVKFQGERHDCGHLAGWLGANLALAAGRADLAPLLSRYQIHQN